MTDQEKIGWFKHAIPWSHFKRMLEDLLIQEYYGFHHIDLRPPKCTAIVKWSKPDESVPSAN